MSGHVAENICTLLLMNTERMYSVCAYAHYIRTYPNLAAAVAFNEERKENVEDKGGEEEEETIKKDSN